jgi:hypothetical protein
MIHTDERRQLHIDVTSSAGETEEQPELWPWGRQETEIKSTDFIDT